MTIVAIPETIAIKIAGLCDRGKVREENQAMVRHASTRLGDLLVVADGIGDAAAGSRASQMAVDTITARVEGMSEFFPSEIAVEEAVCHANAALAATAEQDCPESGIGATVVVALLRTDTDLPHAIVGHVGDGRAYLVHKRKVTLLTRDHFTAQNLPGGKQVKRNAVAHADASMLTRYLGQKPGVQVDMRELPLEAGDTLLLCSSGLWGHVSEAEIEHILADETRSAEEASRALLNLALDAGGSDNVAIEIARLTQSSSQSAAVACEVEPQCETPEEIASESAFAAAPDMSHSGEPISSQIPVVEPSVSWATPEPITYGTVLGSVQLNATASVQGKFRYTPGPGYLLASGTHTLWVAFYADDSPDNDPLLASASITVLEAAPSIQQFTPPDVPPGVAPDADQHDVSAPATVSHNASTPVAIQPDAVAADAPQLQAPSSVADTNEDSRAADEMHLPAQPKATAARQIEPPLFLSSHSSTKVRKEHKTPGMKWMIASALGAGSILVLLIFMIPRFNWGTQSIATPSVQPPPASAETQPQSSEPDPSLQAPSTRNEPLATAETQRPANNQSGNEAKTAIPTRAQTEMMHDQLTAPSQIPHGVRNPGAENAPSPESFVPASADGLGGGGPMGSVFNTHAEPIVSASKPRAVSAGVATGRLIRQSPAVYPQVAKLARVSGTVVLQATISKTGTITDLHVVSGPPMLRSGALEAVRTWRYKPFLLDNKPVEVQTTIDVVFALDK